LPKWFQPTFYNGSADNLFELYQTSYEPLLYFKYYSLQYLEQGMLLFKDPFLFGERVFFGYGNKIYIERVGIIDFYIF
jgi:hypothetical protein